MEDKKDEITQEIREYKGKAKDWQISNWRWKRRVAYEIIPKFENDILSLVYIGAGFLVFMLGFRGLGSDAFGFLLDSSTGKVYNWLIQISIVFETIMIGLLGLTLFFKPEEDHEFSEILKSTIFPNESLYEGTVKNLIIEIQKVINKLQTENKERLEERINKIVLDLRNILDEFQIEENKLLHEKTFIKLEQMIHNLRKEEEGKLLDEELNKHTTLLHNLINELVKIADGIAENVTKQILLLTETKVDGKESFSRAQRENKKREKILNLYSELLKM